jgi:hypothetical protein
MLPLHETEVIPNLAEPKPIQERGKTLGITNS